MIIYLIPPQSYRLELHQAEINSQSLVIQSEKDMEKFILKFNKVIDYPWGKEGIVQWDQVTALYKTIHFIWYNHFWDCSTHFQNILEIHHCWEWYTNIEKPCVYKW